MTKTPSGRFRSVAPGAALKPPQEALCLLSLTRTMLAVASIPRRSRALKTQLGWEYGVVANAVQSGLHHWYEGSSFLESSISARFGSVKVVGGRQGTSPSFGCRSRPAKAEDAREIYPLGLLSCQQRMTTLTKSRGRSLPNWR